MGWEVIPTNDLRSEVLAIVADLSHDELRVFRFMGRRMLDIGHQKYGPLNLSGDPRTWSKEIAQETSDRLFYEQCREIAFEDRRAERVACFRHDEAFAKFKSAVAPLVTTTFADVLNSSTVADALSDWAADGGDK